MEQENINIQNKILLTVKEASDYTGIGINKIRELGRNPLNNISLHVGKKMMIKRANLEEYLMNQTVI